MSNLTQARQKAEAFINSLPSLGGQATSFDFDQRIAIDMPAQAFVDFIESMLDEQSLLHDAAQTVANRQIDGTTDAAIKLVLLTLGLPSIRLDPEAIVVLADAYDLQRLPHADGSVSFTTVLKT